MKNLSFHQTLLITLILVAWSKITFAALVGPNVGTVKELEEWQEENFDSFFWLAHPGALSCSSWGSSGWQSHTLANAEVFKTQGIPFMFSIKAGLWYSAPPGNPDYYVAFASGDNLSLDPEEDENLQDLLDESGGILKGLLIEEPEFSAYTAGLQDDWLFWAWLPTPEPQPTHWSARNRGFLAYKAKLEEMIEYYTDTSSSLSNNQIFFSSEIMGHHVPYLAGAGVVFAELQVCATPENIQLSILRGCKREFSKDFGAWISLWRNTPYTDSETGLSLGLPVYDMEAFGGIRSGGGSTAWNYYNTHYSGGSALDTHGSLIEFDAAVDYTATPDNYSDKWGYTVEEMVISAYAAFCSGAEYITVQDTPPMFEINPAETPDYSLGGTENLDWVLSPHGQALEDFYDKMGNIETNHGQPQPDMKVAVMVDPRHGFAPSNVLEGVGSWDVPAPSQVNGVSFEYGNDLGHIWYSGPASANEFDQHLANILSIVYPGWLGNEDGPDGRKVGPDKYPGTFLDTPIGPVDIVTTGISQAELDEYDAVIIAGPFQPDRDELGYFDRNEPIMSKIKNYVKQGGNLAANAEQFIDFRGNVPWKNVDIPDSTGWTHIDRTSTMTGNESDIAFWSGSFSWDSPLAHVESWAADPGEANKITDLGWTGEESRESDPHYAHTFNSDSSYTTYEHGWGYTSTNQSSPVLIASQYGTGRVFLSLEYLGLDTGNQNLTRTSLAFYETFIRTHNEAHTVVQMTTGDSIDYLPIKFSNGDRGIFLANHEISAVGVNIYFQSSTKSNAEELITGGTPSSSATSPVDPDGDGVNKNCTLISGYSIPAESCSIIRIY